jgi:pyrroline-5-carboxylate reductase
MSEIKLGIIGGGQLGSMLSDAAKKLNIKTVIYCDDLDAPAKNFCDEFIFGKYDEKEKINEFIEKVHMNLKIFHLKLSMKSIRQSLYCQNHLLIDLYSTD